MRAVESFFSGPPHGISLLDLHGQVTKVHYPVKARHFISWSPKGFARQNNYIVEVPRAHYHSFLRIRVFKIPI